VIQAPPLNTQLNITRVINADGFIWSIRAFDLNLAGQGNAQIQVEEGGQGNHQATLRIWNTVVNQPVNFRIEVYAGVGMTKASTIFLAIAFFISYLLK
jgi:hypothetical protein